MAADLAFLKSRGISAANYKKIFSLPRDDWPTRIKTLTDTIAARIRDGYTACFADWRAHYAVDLAYELPFNQTTPTLVQHILSQHLDLPGTKKALGDWGLADEDLFLEIKTPSGRELVLNVPVFYRVLIPLVKAYVSVRLSKLFNDINVEPFLEYKPLKEIETDRVQCEVLTDIIGAPSRWYGYPSVMRQMLLQSLKYGVALCFPREQWHRDRQMFGRALGPETVTLREGIRYIVPDPTQQYYDLSYPLTSLNTDSGIRFLGHWTVLPYGEILDNPAYWNRKAIFGGTNWFLAPNVGNYFQEFYPCQMKHPRTLWEPGKREDAAGWYNTAERDQQVFLTNHYEKLVPKDWGLGDYKYPVWHRFVMAGDDTPVWVEPFAYCPSWFIGYDYDDNAARTSSFALECIPWQDHLGNLLSQMVLTAKQNLDSVVFYDTNTVNEEDIVHLRNLGDRRYRTRQYIGFNSLERIRANASPAQAFVPVDFPKLSIQELAQLMPITISMMERILQISAQEVGAQATHQQSKYELQQLGGASANRVYFTASYRDEGIYAWKVQLLEAHQAHAKPDFIAQVSEEIPNLDAVLASLGMTITSMGKTKRIVAGSLKQITLNEFARVGEGIETVSDKETAQVLFTLAQTIAAQPDLFREVGAKNLMKIVELAARFGGAPRGFRVPVLKAEDIPQDGQVNPQIIEAIKMAQQATLQAVQQKIGEPAAQELGAMKQQVAAIEQALEQLSGIYKIAAAAQEKTAIAQREAQQRMALKNLEFQHEQQRKDAALEAEQRRKNAELEAEIRRGHLKAGADVAAKGALTSAQIDAERVKADAAAQAAAAKPKNEE